MINYGNTSNVTAFDKRTMGRGYKIHILDGGKRKRLIIPIHRSYERHWVLCVVHPTRKSIAFFDSFANKKLWRRDVQDVAELIHRLADIATAHGHTLKIGDSSWHAYSTSTEVLQTNGYDCGVWALACIAAVI